jgi:putative transposase
LCPGCNEYQTMSNKFQNKYRFLSARLKNWDYGRNAAYFETMCTKDRDHYFGKIKNGKMQVSLTGAVAYVLWAEIKHHSKNIQLDEFVVMPNHVHGILILKNDTPSVEGTMHALYLPSQQPPSQ